MERAEEERAFYDALRGKRGRAELERPCGGGSSQQQQHLVGGEHHRRVSRRRRRAMPPRRTNDNREIDFEGVVHQTVCLDKRRASYPLCVME